jgi:hypothetical protein
MVLSLSLSSIKRLSYLVLIALSGIYFFQLAFYPAFHPAFLHPSNNTILLVLTTFLLAYTPFSTTFTHPFTSILVTLVAGLTAAFTSLLAGFFAPIFLLLLIYLFLITFICSYLGQRYSNYYFPLLIVNLLVIIAAAENISIPQFLTIPHLYQLLQPCLIICAGTLIVSLWQIILYPYFFRDQIQLKMLVVLKNLKKLNDEIFSCFLQPDYIDNIYLYERRLHVQKTQCLYALNNLRKFVKLKQASQTQILFLSLLEGMFENILDYSQLRRRVTDYSTLSVCSQELQAVSQEIDKTLGGMCAHIRHKKYYLNQENLTQKINLLEANYNNVLRVASPEPLVFLLFIDSLQAFTKTAAEALTLNV